jgi:hypothetical protein
MGGGPTGASPHADLAAALEAPQVSRGAPSAEVPPGTIRVVVLEADGRPAANAAVDIGVLAQGSQRSNVSGRADGSGVATFASLATGPSQAYRVNVPHLGATYSSAPFQLPTDDGYEVHVVRLPVTREPRYIFFQVFRVIVELKDERLHVIHEVELTNAGRETYVFPQQGLRVALPEGALAFQFQRVMTDQRVEQVEGGYVLRGSLPSGTVQLSWTYDLPVSGETMRLSVGVPLRFFGLQVISEAPAGLRLSVAELPEPREAENGGRKYWLTQVRRRPDDASPERLQVTLSGIPGPGPQRWIALGLAGFVLLIGVIFYTFRERGGAPSSESRRRRRDALIDEARQLDEDLRAGEIGREYRQSRRAELVRELALLLHEEETARERAETTNEKGAGARADGAESARTTS